MRLHSKAVGWRVGHRIEGGVGSWVGQHDMS